MPKGAMALLWLLSAKRGKSMLKMIAAIIFLLWVLGFILHVAGSLIHLLLGIALAVFLVDLLTSRRHAV